MSVKNAVGECAKREGPKDEGNWRCEGPSDEGLKTKFQLRSRDKISDFPITQFPRYLSGFFYTPKSPKPLLNKEKRKNKGWKNCAVF